MQKIINVPLNTHIDFMARISNLTGKNLLHQWEQILSCKNAIRYQKNEAEEIIQ